MADPRRLSSKPPVASIGVLGWLRENLFSSTLNTLLTFLSLAILYFAGRSILGWAFTQANWGAVTGNLKVLTWGRYPAEQVWRLGVSLLLLVGLGLMTWRIWRLGPSPARRWVLLGWAISPILLTVLIRGITLPTPATIANNLGYYLFRPDVLPLLEESWRGSSAITWIGLLAGLTLGMVEEKRARLGALLAVAAGLGFLLPLGLQLEPWVFGLKAPILLPLLVNLLLAGFIGRAAGRSLANIGGIRKALAWIWAVSLPLLIIMLTNFDVGVARVAPVEVLPIVEPQHLERDHAHPRAGRGQHRGLLPDRCPARAWPAKYAACRALVLHPVH